jgi:mycofactocin glycosyltransferase
MHALFTSMLPLLSTVRVSVIIPSYNSAATIERCLRSLDPFDGSIETIVVDSSADGTAQMVGDRARAIRSERRLFPGDARNLGAAHATGDILAFLDSDCYVPPDWLDAVVRAHASRYAAVGGALHNGNPESLAGWAHYLFEFSAWLPDERAHEQPEIPGGCLSIKREAFERCGGFPEGTYSEDTALSWRLREAGERLLFAPSIRVFHMNREHFGELVAAKYQHGAFFARLRAKRLPEGIRYFYAAGTPLLPFLLLARTAARVFRNGQFRGRFARVLPGIAMLAIAWSAGELRGYLSRP